MKKSEATRQMIIKKAAQAFNMYGFAGTPMSKLMEVTGLEKGGLYGHFPSKEELAVASFDFAYSTSIDKRFTDLESIKSYEKKLETFILNFGTFKTEVSGGCPVFNTAVGNMHESPVLKKKAKEGYQKWIANIAELIDGAVKEGSFKKVKSEDLAIYILNSLEGALVATQLAGDAKIISKASEELLKYIEWKCKK
jgi:TetR/AcrR family transcriptional repressor of nem operon